MAKVAGGPSGATRKLFDVQWKHRRDTGRSGKRVIVG
jgi:hypothetical protein